jgi:hypothetical protein
MSAHHLGAIERAREIAQMKRRRKAWYGVDEIGEPESHHHR